VGIAAGAASRGGAGPFRFGGCRWAETVMVGSVVASDGAGGPTGSGMVAAGVSGAGAGCAAGDGSAASGGGVCAEARTLSAASTHNAKAH